MTAQSAPATPRASASRVAKWFLSKGRTDDAVQVLTAWAVTGPNDQEGQNLLAEALRIDPSAAVAKAAFERMEGIAGEHGELDAAIARYSKEELSRIEAEIKRPSFRRAQVGFNNNMKFRDQVFHVQTEDSGLDKPHIITHLFADGGRVIKSHKRTYASEVSRADVSAYVRALMKQQHMEMVLMLREGKFDEILAGKRIGGMELLTEAPNVDVRKISKGKKEPDELASPAEQIARAQFKVAEPPAPAAAAEPAPPSARPATIPAPPPEAARDTSPELPVRMKLAVVRASWRAPDVFRPRGDEVFIGRADAGVLLAGERFCAPREAVLRWKEGKLWVEDVDGGNGVFLRIKTPVEVEIGDEFIVGEQLVRILENPVPDVDPGPGPTYFYSSPTWLSSFRLAQIYEGEREGACVVAHGTTVVVGSSVADLVFPNDPLVDEQHCIVEEQAGTVVLTDLDSRTGVFVRVKGEHELANGDEVLVGRTRLRVELPAS
ncbi:MAG TPA: FHA domain-containing protein [Polyangiaceae bacterium]